MKPHTLPVKRRPVTKGILKRLSAVTGNRKQRVAATASASDLDGDDNSSKISRALTIIFLIHIVAIGLIFVHKHFLEGKTIGSVATVKAEPAPSVAAIAPVSRAELPKLSSGDSPYLVSRGDNYSVIAKDLNVDEEELKLINKHIDIRPGLILSIPPKRIVAEEPAEVTAIRSQAPSDADRGLVENIDVTNAPRAQLVRPNLARTASTASATPALASGKSYVVQNGDSVWRIANRFKVSQDALMKANGISDARKMKIGMTLSIPK